VAETKTKKTKTKKTSARGKGAAAKKTAAKKKSAAGRTKSAAKRTKSDAVVTIDRRSNKDRRSTPDRRKKSAPVATERRKIERRAKVNRRRQIDPTTCERDYTVDEIEFMNALDDYKRSSGRMFPTCSEILEVVRKLGYEKRQVGDPAEPAAPETAPEGQEPAEVTLELVEEPELAV
jgi:hypothetical protein